MLVFDPHKHTSITCTNHKNNYIQTLIRTQNSQTLRRQELQKAQYPSLQFPEVQFVPVDLLQCYEAHWKAMLHLVPPNTVIVAIKHTSN